MVHTPQVSSKPGLAPPPASTGKASKTLTRSGESFANLLGGKSGDVAAAVTGSPASSAAAAQIVGTPLQGRTLSKGQQAKPVTQASSSESSGAADVAQATESQPLKGEHTPLPAVNSAFLQLSFPAKGSPGTASAKQNPAAAVAANAPAAGVNAKSAKSERSAETIAPPTPIDASTNGNFALLAAQIQSVPDTAAKAQTQGRAETSAGRVTASGQTAARAVLPAGVNAADATTATEAQAAASHRAAGQEQSASLGGAPVAGTASATASESPPVSGAPSKLTIESVAPGLTATASESQPAGGAPSKLAAESAVPSFTVTDVRTHFAPETQTAKSQALESAITGTAATLPADPDTAGVASGAGQGSSPGNAAGSTGSHAGRSGGQPPTPPPADKQAVQSSEAGATLAASLSGQSAPSPVHQVFDAIQSAMPAAAEGQTAAAANSPPEPADSQPLKTITIAFQPGNLGTVTVQISLKSSQLGVRLDASDSSTAQLLRQHDSDLTEMLQSAGYVVGSIAVHAASQAAPADAQSQPGAGGQNAFDRPGTDGSGTGGASTGAEGQAQRQPSNPKEQREGGYGRSETANSDRSLYV